VPRNPILQCPELAGAEPPVVIHLRRPMSSTVADIDLQAREDQAPCATASAGIIRKRSIKRVENSPERKRGSWMI